MKNKGINIIIGAMLLAGVIAFPPHHVLAVDCTVPISGNIAISSTCIFPGTIDGADAGTGTTNTGSVTVSNGATLTVSAGQTIAVGSLIPSGGSIAIIQGGQIKIGTPLWMTDDDNDGYPASSTQIAQVTTPTSGKRRNAFSLFTYTSNRTYDYNDASASVYPGTTCNGVCSTNNTDGTCGAKTAGKNGLAACTYCNGTSLSAANVAAASDTYNECTASYNSCSGTSKIGPDGNCNGAGACNTGGLSSACATASTCQTGGGCSAGSCVSVSNAANGTDPNNECTLVSNAAIRLNSRTNRSCTSICNDYTNNSGYCNGAGACNSSISACISVGTNATANNGYWSKQVTPSNCSTQGPFYCSSTVNVGSITCTNPANWSNCNCN